MADLMRIAPLDGLSLPETAGFSCVATPAATRFILRAAPDVAAGIIRDFGCEPPARLRATRNGPRAALWLGPDEWLLITEGQGSAEFASGRGVHSLVDISHRQAGLLLSGPRAALALNGGCPLDLDLAAFPVGMAVPTIFAKAEIVLWRTGHDEFRVDVWRSFADYVTKMVCEAARLAP